MYIYIHVWGCISILKILWDCNLQVILQRRICVLEARMVCAREVSWFINLISQFDISTMNPWTLVMLFTDQLSYRLAAQPYRNWSKNHVVMQLKWERNWSSIPLHISPQTMRAPFCRVPSLSPYKMVWGHLQNGSTHGGLLPTKWWHQGTPPAHQHQIFWVNIVSKKLWKWENHFVRHKATLWSHPGLFWATNL